MKKNILITFIALIAVFTVAAQTPEEIYAVASKSVRVKMDENKKNGENLLTGIAAEHVFKITRSGKYNIADIDVHIHEAPGMINYAMNLNTSWSKIKSLEFQCIATFTHDEIKAYFEKIEVTITKDKVTYRVQ